MMMWQTVLLAADACHMNSGLYNGAYYRLLKQKHETRSYPNANKHTIGLLCHKRKYRFTKWNILCWPKDQGGLGIEVLETKNKYLLSKWLYKLQNEKGVCQKLLRNKYLHSNSLSK
jgi:hypothetical protein